MGLFYWLALLYCLAVINPNSEYNTFLSSVSPSRQILDLRVVLEPPELEVGVRVRVALCGPPL